MVNGKSFPVPKLKCRWCDVIYMDVRVVGMRGENVGEM